MSKSKAYTEKEKEKKSHHLLSRTTGAHPHPHTLTHQSIFSPMHTYKKEQKKIPRACSFVFRCQPGSVIIESVHILLLACWIQV